MKHPNMPFRILPLAVLATCATLAASAQQRDTFLMQQLQGEVNRTTGQLDVMQNNFDDLQRRVGRLEGGGDTRGMRQEIEALKASVAELRREMKALRGEIVRDLSTRLSKMQPPAPPPSAPKRETRTVTVGPHQEYVVKSGDTLSLIAEAFGCPVRKIREMNNLKSDSLRVGQKLKLPK